MSVSRVTPGEKFITSDDIVNALQELDTQRNPALLIDATQLDPSTSTYNEKLQRLVEKEVDIWISQQFNVFAGQKDWTEDDEDLYQSLLSVNAECENYNGWKNGIQLIREDVMDEYAQETAVDLGFVASLDQWPATCIDWDQAVEEMKQDYRQVEYGDYTYFVRYQ